jgi:hypothetical protein
MPICPFSAARCRAVLPDVSVKVLGVRDSGVLWREEECECREEGGVGYPLLVRLRGNALDGRGDAAVDLLEMIP